MIYVCFHMNQIGDLVFSLPALKNIRAWNPDAKIISVARPSGKILLERTGLVDEILVRNKGGLKYKSELSRTISSYHPDTAVLFSQSPECMFLARLSGASKVYGRSTRWQNWLMTHRVDCDGPPSMQGNLKIISLLGCPTACTSYAGLLSPKPEDKNEAEQLLAASGIDSDDDLIVIAPGTSTRRSSKAWTDEGWKSVADHFSSRGGTRVACVGSEDLSALVSLLGRRCIDLTRKTSLPVLLAVLSRAKAVIGVDSGVIHLAAAVGSKVVGLYGVSDYNTTGPQGEGHIVISAEVECSPCFKSTCDAGRRCMTEISSARVIEAAESILQSTS